MSKPILIQNARVRVNISRFHEKPVLTLEIDGGMQGTFQHTFPTESKEVQEALDMDFRTLERMYDGGHYAFYQGSLVEYRKANYNGFVQSQEAISRLTDALGAGMKKQQGGRYSRGVSGLYDSVRTARSNGVMFGGSADPFEFDVAELGEGGSFDASLVRQWSMFSQNIELSLNVQRLVCTNGMVANSPFITRSVPVINDWETNLDIVRQQLEPHFTGVMQQRFREMADVNNRASVQAVMKANALLQSRSAAEHMTAEDRMAITRLLNFTDVRAHLGTHYQGRALSDAKVASAIGSHMTSFDLFNVITEANSRYGRDSDTDRSANMLVNNLMFDELKKRPVESGTLKVSDDSDHRRAFFGE